MQIELVASREPEWNMKSSVGSHRPIGELKADTMDFCMVWEASAAAS
jgi:hypothetical protein